MFSQSQKRVYAMSTKRKNKNIGLSLIAVGLILLFFNIFVSVTTSHSDFGNLVINSMEKPEFTQNITILIIVSTASWAVPILFIFLGALVIKKHTEEI